MKATADGKLYHEGLLQAAAQDAKTWAKETWPDVDTIELAVEIMVTTSPAPLPGDEPDAS